MKDTDQLPVVKYEKPVNFFNKVATEDGPHPLWVHLGLVLSNTLGWRALF